MILFCPRAATAVASAAAALAEPLSRCHCCCRVAVAAPPSCYQLLLSISPRKVQKKNARDTPSQRKACNLDRIRETHQKNTSPCAYSLALIGGRLWHHRHTWMAVSHGQYRDRRASNIVQVILVWLAHPLLPLFRRRAPRSNPLLSPPHPLLLSPAPSPCANAAVALPLPSPRCHSHCAAALTLPQG